MKKFAALTVVAVLSFGGVAVPAYAEETPAPAPAPLPAPPTVCEREVERLQAAIDFETLRRATADDRSVVFQTALIEQVLKNDRLTNEVANLKRDVAEVHGFFTRERARADRLKERVDRLRARLAARR